jgi:hypothetical protein
MDRELVYGSVLLLSLSALLVTIGCKSADLGPRPMVMPARPVMNVPSAYSTAGRPSKTPSLTPASSTETKPFSARRPRTIGLRMPTLGRLNAN